MKAMFYKSFLTVAVLLVVAACGKNNDSNNQSAAVPTSCTMPGQVTAQGCLIGGTCQMNQGWYVQPNSNICVQTANGIGVNGQYPPQYPGQYIPQQPTYGYWGGNPNLAPYGQVGYGAGITIGAGIGFGGYAVPTAPRYQEQLFYSGCGYGCSQP